MLAPAVDTVVVENPDLPDVTEEDRPLVRDVIAVMETLGMPGPRLVRTWTATQEGNYVIVHGSVDPRISDWVIGYDDLDALRQLDMYRVHVSVKGGAAGGPVQIVAKITTRAVPVSITECFVTRVQKRKRWVPW